MMDSLRTAANSLVLKIIFGVIIASFILTGVSSYLIGGNNNYAAKVNGQEISRGQFENAVASERNRLQQQDRERFSEMAGDENFMKAMRQQVLSQLVDEALLDQYAKVSASPSATIRLSRRFSRPGLSGLTVNSTISALPASSTRWACLPISTLRRCAVS